MIVSIEPVHIVWAAGLAITALGALLGLGRWLIGQLGQRMDDRFAMLADEARAWRRTERDVMELRGHVSEHYVRREDWVRNQSVVEAKLDALAAKLELLQEHSSVMRGKHG